MDAFDAIMTTRAMRRLSDQAVSVGLIEQCLEAAQQAPSGGNVQPQHYVVVRDAEVRARLGDVYRRAYDRYEASLPSPDGLEGERRESYLRTRAASRYLADNIAAAPVIVVFLQPLIPWGGHDEEGPLDIGRLDASVYPAVQNFCVAARSLGLGTTLTTVIRVLHGEALEVIGAPRERFEIAALVPVGYPLGRFGRAPRRPASRSTHFDRWGNTSG
ncbi:MAG: nitroreductase family protein [Ilumatobacteraceae bacterium]